MLFENELHALMRTIVRGNEVLLPLDTKTLFEKDAAKEDTSVSLLTATVRVNRDCVSVLYVVLSLHALCSIVFDTLKE